MKTFVVTMYRGGSNENHSYVLGVWSNKKQAEKYGYTEEAFRGGKYSPEISEWNIDACECDRMWYDENQ